MAREMMPGMAPDVTSNMRSGSRGGAARLAAAHGGNLAPSGEVAASPWRWEIRLLFLVAACVFTVTVLIGMINGQRVFELSQATLLTHVHAGTLGWITLGVFALSLWLFGGGAERTVATGERQYVRWLGLVAATAIPVYVAAFASGNFAARAVGGVPVLLAIAGLFGWVIWRATRAQLGVAHLALLGALLTLSLGALLGVLLQFQFATGAPTLPAGSFSAHPAALVTGYLVLIGMAVSEWRLRPATRDDFRLGVTQIACFLASGLLVGVAFLANMVPLLALNTLLLLAGLALYLWRFARRLFSPAWSARSSERFFAASGVFISVNVVLTIFLAIGLVAGLFPGGEPPAGLLLALDHTMFIGVMTNALFGLILDATRDHAPRAWGWTYDVIFWGTNIGLAGFAVGLIANLSLLERVFTPIMGISLLLAIGLFAMLLVRRAASVPVRASA